MNILPKKRWHVRTKDNIARVRRDEAKAAEEQKELERRIKLANQEARTAYLRSKCQSKNRQVLPSREEKESSSNKHVNFFNEIEEAGGHVETYNKEHAAEKKAEQDKFEKRIGLLTYLGQDISNEIPWYVKIPGERTQENSEDQPRSSNKRKQLEDPLVDMHRHLLKKSGKLNSEETSGNHLLQKLTSEIYNKNILKEKEKDEEIKNKNSLSKDYREVGSYKHFLKLKNRHKHKKHKKNKETRKEKKHHSNNDIHDKHLHKHKKLHITEPKQNTKTIEELRAERLQREKVERERAEQLIKKHKGIEDKQEAPPIDERYQRYNSQFNPHLARQSRTEP